MKKTLLRLLLCFAMVAALLSAISFCSAGTDANGIETGEIGDAAESVIGTLNITGITEPRAGATPAGAEALTADNGCTVTDCVWLDSETMEPAAVFAGGKTYVLRITCASAEGFLFDNETVAYFDGNAAVTDAPGTFSRIYECPRTTITSVSIRAITVPTAGAAPADAGSFVLDGTGYSIKDSRWTDSDGNAVDTFADGQTYTLTVRLVPAEDFCFADTEVTLNGKAARALDEPGAWSLDFVCGAFDGVDCTGDQTVCPAAQFIDAPKYGVWSHEGIDYCVDLGLMNGIGEGKFNPNGAVTRAQLVTILYRVAGSPKVTFTGAFRDVKAGLWYSDAIEWAAANGIVNGTKPGVFSPTSPITREQIAAILYRYSNSPTVSGNLNAFPDKGAVRAYAVDAMIWATGSGYINGIESRGVTRLSSGTNATRAQIASIIMRCLEDYKKVYRHDDTAPNSKLTQSFDVYFASQKLSLPIECMGNRPYIALDDLAAMPVTQPSDEALKDLHWDKMKHLDKLYITLADAAAIYNLGVEFRDSDSSIHLYKLQKPTWNTAPVAGATKTAFLRLEDIMADYGNNDRFTHDGLIKLRTQADYLNAVTDAYYIAWIPLYVNPGKNIRNDISTDFSFYNTDFVFTLDCMVRGKGHLGLHGLTHQSGNDISADGYEFGTANTYTTEQLLDRFRSAEAICHRLGYDYDFFEFSHYDATEEQKKVAEAFFDNIAQARVSGGYLERKYTLMHDCLWVPTPAGYVHSAYDRDGILQRLDDSYKNGYEISLFFHPVVDTKYFGFSVKDDTMTVTMNESGFLSTIVGKIGGWGYKFGALPTD